MEECLVILIVIMVMLCVVLTYFCALVCCRVLRINPDIDAEANEHVRFHQAQVDDSGYVSLLSPEYRRWSSQFE